MNENLKKTLDILKTGLFKLLIVLWIILLSFSQAITISFYNNFKIHWKRYMQKPAKKEEKPAEKKEEPKP